MTELTKGERARKKLVDATASLLRRQGYHATGLSEIVEESGAPRGSLYFYFPGGKDELACEALQQSGLAWSARIASAIDHATNLDTAIDAIVKLLADDLEASGWDNGCPVAAVALESTSRQVRTTIERHYELWLAAIADRLHKFGATKASARKLAVVSLAAIEGALLLARVQKSREPLVVVGNALKTLGAAPPRKRAR
ncbi:MAG TPA: TetR/AcrR family transcriptional regulator [Kofleriaceae bacterium]|nr:TetR/AcrR family transcriptional regulator [Kofleriaceae bacterium]